VPRLAPDEDVRKVAQLMIDSDSRLLPVFEGQELVGVVTVDDILRKVEPFLDAATVAEAHSADLVSIGPATTLGDALNVFRENHITHLPVVEGNEAVGILSLYDVTGITVRAEVQSQGGDAGGTDPFGVKISASTARAGRGGFGAREGSPRMLDLPVRDIMVSPVRTIRPDETLDVAVDEMFEIDASSLVVTENGAPHGIVTKTDVLDSLTWEAGGTRGVQVYGTDLIDDVAYDEIVAMVEKFDDRDHGMNVLDARVHLHEHDETRRGRPPARADSTAHRSRALHRLRRGLRREPRDKRGQGSPGTTDP